MEMFREFELTVILGCIYAIAFCAYAMSRKN